MLVSAAGHGVAEVGATRTVAAGCFALWMLLNMALLSQLRRWPSAAAFSHSASGSAASEGEIVLTPRTRRPAKEERRSCSHRPRRRSRHGFRSSRYDRCLWLRFSWRWGPRSGRSRLSWGGVGRRHGERPPRRRSCGTYMLCIRILVFRQSAIFGGLRKREARRALTSVVAMGIQGEWSGRKGRPRFRPLFQRHGRQACSD